jgi:ketosteroid isomerase-like protein
MRPYKVVVGHRLRWRSVAVSSLVLIGCFSLIERADSAPASAAMKKGVEDVLSRQCDAWNRGDLDEFMTGYLDSEDTSFTSGGTEVWGYKALRDRYQKKYGDNKQTMGKLKFSDLKTIELGPKNALVIGHWHLDPENPPAIDGVFSLVFARTKEGWKVVHDHTSVLVKK